MVSLNELKQKEAEKKIKADEDVKEKRKASLNKTQKQYEAVKKVQANIEEKQIEDTKELDNIKKKRFAISSALKSVIKEIKDGYKNAKKDPESLFRDFFQKGEHGNILNKLDGMKVGELDDIKNSVPKNRELGKRKKNLVRGLGLYEKRKGHIDNLKKRLYPKTEKYLKDKYLDDYFFSNIETHIRQNGGSIKYLFFPIKRVEELVNTQSDQIENVKDIVLEEVKEKILKEKEAIGLTKLASEVKEKNDFDFEKNKLALDIQKFNKELIDFADKIYDIESVSSYYGSKTSLQQDTGPYSIRERYKYISQFLDKDSQFQIISNEGLELIKKQISTHRIFMSHVLRLQEEGDIKSINNIFEGNNSKLLYYKEIVGKDNFVPIDHINEKELYPKDIFNYINKNDFKDFYSIRQFCAERLKKFNEKEKSLLDFAEQGFDSMIKWQQLVDSLRKKGFDKEYIKSFSMELNKIYNEKTNLELFFNDSKVESLKILDSRLSDKLDETIYLKVINRKGYDMAIFGSQKEEYENIIKRRKEIEVQSIGIRAEITDLNSKKLGVFESEAKHKSKISSKTLVLDGLSRENNELSAKLNNIEQDNQLKDLSILFGNVDPWTNNRMQLADFYKANFSHLFKDKDNILLRDAIELIKNEFNSKILELTNKYNSLKELEPDIKEYYDIEIKYNNAKFNVESSYKQ